MAKTKGKDKIQFDQKVLSILAKVGVKESQL